MFQLRFDLRVPPMANVTHADQYRTMLEMVRWADTRGFAGTVVSEHHGTPDGFMCSPLIVASAILGSTRNLTCMISALLVPLHDPLRLAEDIATIDNLAPGRLIVVAALGYRENEFEMFAKARPKRARLLEDAVHVMQTAWRGEPFEWDGRACWITPRPTTAPHPHLWIGGSVEKSARRAARLGLPFQPMVYDPALTDAYYDEARTVGFDTPFAAMSNGPGLVIVSEDPEAVWARIGPNLLFDAEQYANWQYADQRSDWAVEASTVAELRAAGQHAIVTPDECIELARRDGAVLLHPICGGIDPEIGWESLELVHNKVMPALAAS